MPIIDSIISELEQEASTTRRVLERVPEASLAWKPHAKSMSLGQLALHVASTPGQVAEILTNDSIEVPQFQAPAATSSAELLSTFAGSIVQAKQTLAKMDDSFVNG